MTDRNVSKNLILRVVRPLVQILGRMDRFDDENMPVSKAHFADGHFYLSV